MAKFSGKIGYCTPVKTSAGVYSDSVIEKDAIGDMLKNIARTENSSSINDNIRLSNQISLLLDPFASLNSQFIKYVKIGGVAWKVVSIDMQPPRLILTLGGVYNGIKA